MRHNNRIFISGAISCDPNYRAKFKNARYVLENARRDCTKSKCTADCPFHDIGYLYTCHIYDLFPDYFTFVNPVDMGLEGKPWWWCMVVCLLRLSRCSYVYFLSDWNKSRGARLEHRLARLLNKRIIYQKKEQGTEL